MPPTVSQTFLTLVFESNGKRAKNARAVYSRVNEDCTVFTLCVPVNVQFTKEERATSL